MRDTKVFKAFRVVEGFVGLDFEWHGGPYIEISFGRAENPSEVINVWDYETSKPSIEVSQSAFEAKIDEWIEEYGEASLAHDAVYNW